MPVIKGKQEVAPKVMIYGLASSGKSTLAATLPNALFLDIEGGLSFLDVDKVPIENADHLMRTISYYHNTAINGKKEYKYIIIDSVDWAVNLFAMKTTGMDQAPKEINQLMEAAKMTLNKSQGGYGNGKQVLENFVRNVFLMYLNLLNRNGIGIILIAHADRRTLLDSDGTNIERLAPKMDINSMNAFVEWTDNMFYLKSDDDGTRHLIVNPTDDITAKNRMGLTQDEFIVDDKFDFEKLITGKMTASSSNVTKE